MKCLAALAAASVAFGDNCSDFVEAARAAYENKQYQQAAGQFELALRACPLRVPILLDLAKARFLAQEFEQTLEALGQLLAIETRHAPALKLQGDSLYLLGRNQEAEQALLAAASIDPANPEPNYALGRIYYQQGRFEDSIERLRKVLELDPKSYRAYDNLGLAYEGLNDIPQAVAHYEHAMQLSAQAKPPYDWVFGNMSNLMHKTGDYKKAFQFGAEAAHRNPNSARNFFLTGKALAKLERWELAAKWLGQSVALDAQYAEARYQYAQVLRKLGHAEQADEQLAAFKEINAKQPRSRR